MSLSACLKQYLDKHRVSYHILSHPTTVTLNEAASILDIPANMMLRSVLLGDERGLTLAVLPLTYKIDFSMLRRITGRDLKILPRHQVDRIFFDCEPGSHPPLGEPYSISVLVDSTIAHLSSVYFEPGTHTSVVRMQQNEFQYLYADHQWAHFSVSMEVNDSMSSHWEPQPKRRQALVHLHKPEMESLGEKILETGCVPMPSSALKEALKSKGPALETHIRKILSADETSAERLNPFIRYISEGAQDWTELTDERQWQAVAFLWASFEMSDLFKTRDIAPLGKTALMLHALVSGFMMQEIVRVHFASELDSITALRAGLAQNIGFLLMGHLFPPEFQMLNKMAMFNPKTPINLLEKRLVGMGKAQHLIKKGHAILGAWLLTNWGLPPEIQVITSFHHRPDYKGPNEVFVQLLYWLNAHLKKHRIGDGCVSDLSSPHVIQFSEAHPQLEGWCEEWCSVNIPLIEQGLGCKNPQKAPG